MVGFDDLGLGPGQRAGVSLQYALLGLTFDDVTAFGGSVLPPTDFAQQDAGRADSARRRR